MTSKSTILIVDRNVIFRVAIMEMIYARFPDIRLLDSHDVGETLELVERHHPNLVLLDISLNGDGLTLMSEIRALAPDTTIAVFTSDDFPEYREAAGQQGGEYFFSKAAPNGRKIIEMIESHFS